MKLKKLQVVNFRTYEELEFIPSENINILYGRNAIGKTNILEAIYVSAIGKSYRADKDCELIQFEKSYAKINTQFVTDDRKDKTNDIELYLDNQKKAIKDNGFECKKISEHLGKLSIVIFSPDDLNIVKGTPAKRRKFLDVLISQISKKYLAALQNYNKYLKIRNTVLKQDKIDDTYLDIIDLKLAEYAEFISSKRNKIIELILEKAKKIHQDITCKNENIDIKYKSDFVNLTKDQIIERLKRSRKIDIIKKSTILGIQKDDIEIKLNDLTDQYFSQGQARTALLTMKFAEFEVLKEIIKDEPILLLDDVFSELDNYRINYILEYISKYQSIITTNEIDNFKLENIKFFNIQKGKLIKK